MRSHSMHYAGAMSYVRADGQTVEISSGYAACCSGDRARKIRARGHHTLDAATVTCKRCLNALRLAAQR